MFAPNELVLAKYSDYPPWPAKIVPDYIGIELCARINKDGIGVLFFGEPITYGVIYEKDILPFNKEIPSNADEELVQAYKMAIEGIKDYPPLDPPNKKEMEKRMKYFKRQEQIRRKEERSKNEVKKKVKPVKRDLGGKKEEESIKEIFNVTQNEEENMQISSHFDLIMSTSTDSEVLSKIKDEENKNNNLQVNNSVQEKVEENLTPTENTGSITKSNNEEVPLKKISDNSISIEKINYISKRTSDNLTNKSNTCESLVDSDELTLLKSTVPGLIKVPNFYSLLKKKTLPQRLSLVNHKSNSLKRNLCKIILNYPKNTLLANKTLNILESMEVKKMKRRGLLSYLISVYVYEYKVDSLKVKERVWKLIEKILEK